MKKKKKTAIFRFSYIGLTIIAMALIGYFTIDVEEMQRAFDMLKLNWLYACFGCLLLFWLTDALLINDISSYMYKRDSYFHSIKISIIGLYYGVLTPFATGGQPMQVVYMRRRRVPVGTATCIVSVKFVVFELSLCVLFIAAMLVYGSEFYREYGDMNRNYMFWLAILGFIINATAVVFIILTLVNESMVIRTGKALIGFFGKLRIIRKPEKAISHFEKTIEDYHEAAEYIAHHKLRAIGSFLLSVINLLFFFALPYFIYIAFGSPAYSSAAVDTHKTMIDIISLQIFLYITITFAPTPGSAGAAEGGFHVIFSAIFGAGAVFAPMLVWRFLTYYLVLIVGSILVVFDEVFAFRKSRRKIRAESGL